MKIERLKKDYRKDIIIGTLVVLLVVIGVWGFVGSKAKYRYTASFPAVKGTINYKSGDISVLAIKLQQGDGTYADSEDFPTSGYTLNTTESYCGLSSGDGIYTKEGNKITYENGEITVANITKKGTKCFLYFDKIACDGVACKTVLVYNGLDTSRISGEFTSAFEENTAGRIFKGPEDDYGTTTYFFAGKDPNNWVKFGQENGKDLYWRIIKINGNGTIRMIYNGITTDQTGVGTQISNDGGTTVTYAFNTKCNDNAYMGYMYGTPGSDNYNDTHANVNDSTVKTEVDKWYNINLNKEGIKEHIANNVGFCGDRSVNTTSEPWWWDKDTKKGYGTNVTAYGPFGRVNGSEGTASVQKPTYKCSQNNDLYTVREENKGNKALTYPAGLITLDEVLFAGGFRGSQNKNYWLYTSQTYLTMSPAYVYTNAADHLFIVDNTGHVSTPNVNAMYGVRPVINLKADTQLIGTGTTTDPYKVV